MRKPGHMRRHIRLFSCMMALTIGFGQPSFVMAAQTIEMTEQRYTNNKIYYELCRTSGSRGISAMYV